MSIRTILSFVILVVITFHIHAQDCERPQLVYVKCDYFIVDDLNQELYQIEKERFSRKSTFELWDEIIPENELFTITELRKLELEIRKCEIRNGERTIYLDVTINDIFNNIYLLVKNQNQVYRARIEWLEAIE